MILELFSRLSEKSEASILAGTMMPMPTLRMMVNRNSPFWTSTSLTTTPLPRLGVTVPVSQYIRHRYPIPPHLDVSNLSGVEEVQCPPRLHLVYHPSVHLVPPVDPGPIGRDAIRLFKIRVHLLDCSSRPLPTYRHD